MLLSGTPAVPTVDPFEAALTRGQVQNGVPMGDPTIAPNEASMKRAKLVDAAMELAKSIPPPQPGQLNEMMKNPQLMQMLMGSVKGYGDERQEMQKAAMSRHYVNPPFSGTGKGMEPAAPGMFALANKRRQGQPISSLGSLLKGG